MNSGKKIKKMKKYPAWIILLIGVAIGAGFSFLYHNIQLPVKKNTNKNTDSGINEVRLGGYKFINPLLECDKFSPSTTKDFASLKKELTSYTDKAISEGQVTHVSVYYRDLNNGPWFGINEQQYFTPASLLKVPMLIAVFKKADEDPFFLKKKVLYDKVREVTLDPNIVGDSLIRIGSEYTVEQLCYYMIVKSDNNAKELLLELLGNDYFGQVMLDLGVNLKTRDLNVDFITIKEYSSFFRILYNASYIKRDLSEKALELLSKVSFDKGLTARLPKNIPVAHKFGERSFNNNSLRQFHECGIIYPPGKPYLLCVMTRGSQFDNLISVIADISEIVYKNHTAPKTK